MYVQFEEDELFVFDLWSLDVYCDGSVVGGCCFGGGVSGMRTEKGLWFFETDFLKTFFVYNFQVLWSRNLPYIFPQSITFFLGEPQGPNLDPFAIFGPASEKLM